MKEGVLVWIMFTAEEKTVLYANDRIHFAEDGKYVPGQLLSPISPPFIRFMTGMNSICRFVQAPKFQYGIGYGSVIREQTIPV